MDREQRTVRIERREQSGGTAAPVEGDAHSRGIGGYRLNSRIGQRIAEFGGEPGDEPNVERQEAPADRMHGKDWTR